MDTFLKFLAFPLKDLEEVSETTKLPLREAKYVRWAAMGVYGILVVVVYHLFLK